MRHGFAFSVMWLSFILAGCSEPEEPHADSIPTIPPGRAALTPADGEGTSGYQPPAPPAAR